MNIYKKLIKVQGDLKAPKGQRNTFGNYNYRSCEDIIEAVKPLLKENGLILNITDEVKYIGDRYYVEATVKVIDIDTGEVIESKALAREDANKKGMDLAQITGSVSSYARKYALNGMFAIDDTKDADATNTHGKEKSSDDKVEQVGYKITAKQINLLKFKASEASISETRLKTTIKADYGLDKIEDLTNIQMNELLDKIAKIKK